MRSVYETTNLDASMFDNCGVSIVVRFIGLTGKDGAHNPFGVGTILFDFMLVDMDDGPHRCKCEGNGTNVVVTSIQSSAVISNL